MYAHIQGLQVFYSEAVGTPLRRFKAVSTCCSLGRSFRKRNSTRVVFQNWIKRSNWLLLMFMHLRGSAANSTRRCVGMCPQNNRSRILFLSRERLCHPSPVGLVWSKRAAMTFLHLWWNASMNVTNLIHMRDMTHSYVGLYSIFHSCVRCPTVWHYSLLRLTIRLTRLNDSQVCTMANITVDKVSFHTLSPTHAPSHSFSQARSRFHACILSHIYTQTHAKNTRVYEISPHIKTQHTICARTRCMSLSCIKLPPESVWNGYAFLFALPSPKRYCWHFPSRLVKLDQCSFAVCCSVLQCVAVCILALTSFAKMDVWMCSYTCWYKYVQMYLYANI